MARQIKLDDREKIEIVDADGVVTGWFRFNPTDTAILDRFKDLEEYFNGKNAELKKLSASEQKDFDINALQEEIKKEFDKLLGYEGAGDAIFKNCSPLAIRANGDIFATYVMWQIAKFMKSEFGVREKRAKSRISKYTAKYKK